MSMGRHFKTSVFDTKVGRNNIPFLDAASIYIQTADNNLMKGIGSSIKLNIAFYSALDNFSLFSDECMHTDKLPPYN